MRSPTRRKQDEIGANYLPVKGPRATARFSHGTGEEDLCSAEKKEFARSVGIAKKCMGIELQPIRYEPATGWHAPSRLEANPRERHVISVV
jgi:hypothetical protein